MSETNPPEIDVPALPTADDVFAGLVAKLPKPVMEVAVVYAPALARLALAELLAVYRLVQAGDYAEAQVRIRAQMTAPELAEEKDRLADLARVMAAERNAKLQWGRQLLLQGLSAAFFTMLL